MQTTHTHRIDIFVLSGLTNAVIEFLQDGRTVGLIVPFAVTRLVPFRRGCIVEEQRFAVTGGNHDAPLVGHLLTLGMRIKGACAGMHGRGKHIALQSENQFADAVVGLGTDIAQLLFKCLRYPCLQSPVLIIDENATILHAGRRTDVVLRIFIDMLVGFIYRNIGKPVPRTDTYCLTHMQHAVGQTPCIRAGNNDVTISRVDGIALPCASQFAVTASLHHRTNGDHGSTDLPGTYPRSCARDTPNVIRQHLRHLLHQRCVTFMINNRCLSQIHGRSLWLTICKYYHQAAADTCCQ